MNITLFIGGVSGGGAERVTCNLANYLVSKGHEIKLLTMADDAPSYTIDKKVHRISLLHEDERKGFLYNSYIRTFRFVKYLKNFNGDAYVVMLPVTTIMLLIFRWLAKAKVIAAERVDPSQYPKKKQIPLKLLAHRADGWVFQTTDEMHWYGTALGKSKAVIIPNAINPDFIKPAYKGERVCEIVTAGRLTDQKNHRLLINSFASINEKFPDYSLIIYGEGPLKGALMQQTEKLGLGERVLFPGYTTNIGERIKNASLFVLSSDFEGMPNALMEAMALGVPCVSTDCDGGGSRFLIEDGINGLLVPKGDEEGLSEAIERLLTDKALSVRLGTEAHKICERLAPEKIYSEWEHFIMNVVNKTFQI